MQEVRRDSGLQPYQVLEELSHTNPKLKYLMNLLNQIHAILMHRIGMRLNRPELMRAGENQYSRTYFMNANLPYSIIYSADFYQDLCMYPAQREAIEKRETFLKNPKNLTTGESQDYNFENENKVLKKILPPNPTFEDFRSSTLVKEDAEKIINNVRLIYNSNNSETTEAGFPNYEGCVFSVREVIRTFLKDEGFKTLAGKEINPEILRFEEIADERRKVFFEEIRSFGKFSGCPHKNHKFPVLKTQKTFEERRKEVLKEIEDSFEDNLEEKVEFLILMNNLMALKTESEKLHELERIVSLLSM